jgi:hypothetical protein
MTRHSKEQMNIWSDQSPLLPFVTFRVNWSHLTCLRLIFLSMLLSMQILGTLKIYLFNPDNNELSQV